MFFTAHQDDNDESVAGGKYGDEGWTWRQRLDT
jgi:hypothetical protein